jgi:two-component system, cell cycle sensor histidine kinase and response regulator CckA
MNLITNASEAIGNRDGVIRVSARAHPGGESGLVSLEVSDTGCGMTEAVRTRVFDPFFSTKFPGRGLGLAAVQGIIRRLGGSIDVVSAPGQGATFTVMLPTAEEQAPAPAPRPVQVFSGSGGSLHGSVLLVEDEESIRVAVARLLRRSGFSVIEAAGGGAALDFFRAQSNIRVVLLDLTLPGMSGREVLQELRRIQPDIKVILTTAYSEEAAMAAVEGQPVWHFLRKPYRIAEVLPMLREALSVTGSPGPSEESESSAHPA